MIAFKVSTEFEIIFLNKKKNSGELLLMSG